MTKVNYEERQSRLVAGYLHEGNIPRHMNGLFLSYLTMPESFDPIRELQRLFDEPDALSLKTEGGTMSSENRDYDSLERLTFTEHSLLAIFKHPLFDRCDKSLYRRVGRMMHQLRHKLPVATPGVAATDICTAARMLQLMLVLQSHPNFMRSMSTARLFFWNEWFHDLAPQLGKDPRVLIKLRLELASAQA